MLSLKLMRDLSIHLRSLSSNLRHCGQAGAATRGQALVEFAFSFSIFALMFFGLMLGAIVLFGYMTTNAAASEGAHYFITYPASQPLDITNQICATTPLLGGSTANCKLIVTVMDDNPSDTGFVAVQCPPPTPPSELLVWVSPYGGNPGQGTLVSVTVCYHVPIPSLSLPALNGGRLFVFGPTWVVSKASMVIPN